MLATADCTNHYSEQIIYESEWTDHIPTGVSWLNLLTAQPIPEEIDGIDGPCTPERQFSESSCSSSSSVESCYVVLEIQRPLSVDKTSSKVSEKGEEEENDDEEEEEEEMEEVIEELNFAQMKHDDHNVMDEQVAVSMTTEVPTEEYVIEYEQEQYVQVEEYAKVTEPVIHEISNDILFHKAKVLNRFSKRMKAMSHVSSKDQSFSTSSDDEPLKVTKLRTIRKFNEYHPTAITSVTSEQQLPIPSTHSSFPSTPSLDSIENSTSPKSPIRTRITTTFSNLSTQRPLNPIQTPRINPTMGTTTLTRTFAFDRACMEKYGPAKQKISEPTEVHTKPICESINKQEIEKIIQKTESLPPLNDQLNYRSFTNTLPTPFYIGSGESTIDESEIENHPTIPRSTSVSHSLSKGSASILTSMKKYVRTVALEYRSTNNSYHENISAEPKLVQLKSLDGKLSLKDNNLRESYEKPQTISGSISHKLNRLGLSKMSSIQDLPSHTAATTTFTNSYRKRMLNRFRTLIEDHTTEQSPSRPWQHKTITELFNEKRNKLNR